MSAPSGEDVIADPVGVIVGLVAEADPAMSMEDIRSEVTRVAGGRAKRRRMAQAICDDPSLLVTGGPPISRAAGELLLGLRAAGSRVIAAPRCGECGRSVSYLAGSAGGLICASCRDKPQPCADCGEERRVHTRDRHGRPRCEHCPDDGDPVPLLTATVTGIDPAVSVGTVAAALGKATARPAGQRRLAWAIADQPALLTGDGSQAPSPAVLRFIDELIRAGATKILPPRCARCDRAVSLSRLLDGRRVCRACCARAKAVACCRCGSVREPAARDADGSPLCPNCLVSDPANLEDCARCGKRRRVAVRTPDGPLCQGCRPLPVLACSICGREKPCEISRATGRPWCGGCQKRWRRCGGCGTMAAVCGGAPGMPLCARCVNPDPGFWDRCPECRDTWVLSTRFPCQRCILAREARQFLGNEDEQVRPDLEPLLRAIAEAERPDTAITWLRQPKVREILSAIGRQDKPVSHETLDEMPPGKTLAHLRAILVATGILPGRDERLLRLEHWTSEAVGQREDPAERRVLHSYATWHHLRKLRNRLRDVPATRLQVTNVRTHVTAAANFLDWLAGQGLTLDSCRQGDLERHNSTQASYQSGTSHFVRWAVKNRHARDLTAGAVRWSGPQGPHDTGKRWDDARRLLNDGTLAIQDRVAGLLLLLYAQRITAITTLTTGDVRDDGATVAITLGTSPVVLPPPLDEMVRELTAARRGHAAIGRPDVTPWLFAGGRPGQPITDDALGSRLKKIGMSPLQDRCTALFALATEVPASILARMLGIHIAVAVQWQRATSGDWGSYAADISRRDPQRP